MAKQPNLDPTAGVLAAVLGAETSGNSAAPNNPVINRVLQLLEMDLSERQRERNEQFQQDENFRTQRRESLLVEEAKLLALQQACPHMKPNYQPNIHGQRDSQQHYHWLCSYCMKEWTDNELPAHLRIPMERVGGPI